MARIDTLGHFLTDVADAIRTKKGTSETIVASDFDTEIASIPSGGGDIPTNGYVVTEWTSEGVPKELTVYGYATVPRGLLKGTDTYDNNFTKLTKIILPRGFGATSSAQDTFANLKSLTTIDTSALENQSMTFGWYAFSGCTALTTFDLTKIKYGLPTGVFMNCSTFNINSIPSSITSIGAYCFQNCTSFTISSLPDTITEIGRSASGTGHGSAFEGCSNITLSKLPDSLTTFMGGSNFKGCSKITISKIPDGVTTLGGTNGSAQFQNCTSITAMDLNNVTTTCSNAFSGCTGLQSVTGENVVTTHSNVFNGCTALTTISLPVATTIGQYLFQNCTSLTNVSIPLGTSLQYGTFANCSSLSSLNIDSVTSISWGTFSGCTGLKKVAIPSVTAVQGNSASYSSFVGCTNLKQVWIGSSVTSSGMARYAFAPCTNLEKMYINLPRATVEGFTNYQYAFMNNTSKTGIIVCNDDPGFITKQEFDALIIE